MSKDTIIRCDKCKQEIEKGTTYVTASVDFNNNSFNIYKPKFCDGDYHCECFREIIKNRFNLKDE